MNQFMQYQTAQAIPTPRPGAWARVAASQVTPWAWMRRVALGQVLAQNLAQGLEPGAAAHGHPASRRSPPVGVKPEEVMATPRGSWPTSRPRAS